jgi:hypothetical protein
MHTRTLKNRMKTFGILFLFATCFLCVSCNKDDDDLQPIELQYAVFNDKANPVTNNQVTISFPDETKAELVIFGGDGTYFINNSDDTKLSISSTDAYLKLTALKPGNVDVTINDRHNNSYILKVQIKSQLRVKMNAKEKEGNIFGLMEFNLFSYSEEDFTLLDLTEAYDSLVWVCSNTNQRYKILEYSYNSSRFTWKWSTCFFLPEEYETVLLGYKNSQVITSDTVSVNIVNNKDFLGYNWVDVVSTSTAGTSYHNVFQKKYDFKTRSVVTDDAPSEYLFLHSTTEREAIFAPKSRQILFNYANLLYSSPTYSSDEGNSLSEVYNKLFKNKNKSATPEYIWVTSKSKIALLKKYDSINGYSNYEIYAEPK